AKVITHGADRATALRTLAIALDHTVIHGVTTNVDFLRSLLRRNEVTAGDLDTGLLDRIADQVIEETIPPEVVAAAALVWLASAEPGADADPFDLPGGWRLGEHAWTPWRAKWADGELEVAVRGRAHDAEVRV